MIARLGDDGLGLGHRLAQRGFDLLGRHRGVANDVHGGLLVQFGASLGVSALNIGAPNLMTEEMLRMTLSATSGSREARAAPERGAMTRRATRRDATSGVKVRAVSPAEAVHARPCISRAWCAYHDPGRARGGNVAGPLARAAVTARARCCDRYESHRCPDWIVAQPELPSKLRAFYPRIAALSSPYALSRSSFTITRWKKPSSSVLAISFVAWTCG